MTPAGGRSPRPTQPADAGSRSKHLGRVPAPARFRLPGLCGWQKYAASMCLVERFLNVLGNASSFGHDIPDAAGPLPDRLSLIAARRDGLDGLAGGGGPGAPWPDGGGRVQELGQFLPQPLFVGRAEVDVVVLLVQVKPNRAHVVVRAVEVVEQVGEIGR